MSFIQSQYIYSADNITDFWKKIREYNARVRAYKALQVYMGEAVDRRLLIERMNLECFFQKLVANRPSIYPYNSYEDSKALGALKEIMQSFDKDNQRITVGLANFKYRYAVDAIRALDRFSYNLSRFNPGVCLQDDVSKHIDELKKQIGIAKANFGNQFEKCWTGYISYIDAYAISNYGEQNSIYVDVLLLSKSIEWFEEIRSLIKQRSDTVIKPKEIHPKLRRIKTKERQYIDSQIELYQANQELAQMRAKLAKIKTK